VKFKSSSGRLIIVCSEFVYRNGVVLLTGNAIHYKNKRVQKTYKPICGFFYMNSTLKIILNSQGITMTDFRQQALDYHALPTPGKISVELTTSAETSLDLSLAYSPGVAEPVREIALNPDDVYKYTGKGNTVAVITNGTAILGLGNLGPMASKPVMEGKALLFKRFAGINSFDIEVDHDLKSLLIP
jgi:malic enzyme